MDSFIADTRKALRKMMFEEFVKDSSKIDNILQQSVGKRMGVILVSAKDIQTHIYLAGTLEKDGELFFISTEDGNAHFKRADIDDINAKENGEMTIHLKI